MRKEFKNVKAKHGLNKKNGIRAIGLSFFRDQKHKRERRRGEEEEEEEEEKKKRREGERKSKRYGTMNSCMNFHTISWLVACPKPRV